MCQRFPWKQIKPYLKRELGLCIDKCFAEFQSKSIAAGSVVQVYGATLPDGQRLAVKVLRPGIEAQMREDGRLLRKVALLTDSTALGSQLDFVGLADQFSLLWSVNWTFVPSGQLRLPGVVEQLLSQRVLVLGWIEGDPVLCQGAESSLAGRPRN